MIRPLRRRHFRMIAALSVILPLLVVAALLSRPAPVTTDLSPVLTSAAVDFPMVVDRAILSTEPPVAVELLADQEPPTRMGLRLMPEAALVIPDVLVYWQREEGPRYLLGTLRGDTPQTFVLPESAMGEGGRVVLHSLARQEDLAVADLASR